MRGMADECIDLIYLDPPFNSNHNYAAPIGSQAAGAEFKDTWTLDEIDLAWYGEIADAYPGLYDLLTATQKIHGNSMMAYLIYMAVRIMEMGRILKPTGSIYLHCDPTASHYLKLLMDEVFGRKNFRNEIVWRYKKYQKARMRHFTRNSDRILFYARTEAQFYPVLEKLKTPKQFLKRVWNKETKRIVNAKDSDGRVQYITVDEEKIDDVWSIPYLMPASKERLGYPTQKPIKLLEYVVRASSNEGDMVLDPFCGCATTCVAAEKLDRQWIGIDVSSLAARLVQVRIERELGVLLFDPIHRTDIPLDRGGERSKNIKHILYGVQEGICNGCLIHFPYVNLTVDHIVPKSKGGADVDENLQLLCARCNSVKGNRTQEYLILQVRMIA